MSQYKPYVLTLSEEQLSWIKKSSKEFKIKTTEFMRMVIDHVKDSTNGDLKAVLMKARLEAQLESVREQAIKATKEQEQLEKELEALNA